MFDDMKRKLDGVMAIITEDLRTIKAGRAKPEMIEDIEVEAYPGAVNALKELASISAPDPNMLLIQPWDQSILKRLETGIRKADSTLNPVVDGNLIRIVVPQLTQERRRDLVKLVRQKIESSKQMMRDVRNDAKKMVESQKGDSGVSEDDIKAWLEDMQKIFDSYQARLETLETDKEKELMEI